MMVRIVKLHITPDFIPDFVTIFKNKQSQILDFEGCTSVELFTDKQNSEIFFTVSHWQSEEYLEEYRKSVFFYEVWAAIKPHFKQKAEAWSLNQLT